LSGVGSQALRTRRSLLDGREVGFGDVADFH